MIHFVVRRTSGLLIPILIAAGACAQQAPANIQLRVDALPQRLILKKGTLVTFVGDMPKDAPPLPVAIYRGTILEAQDRFLDRWKLTWNSAHESHASCTLVIQWMDGNGVVYRRIRLPVILLDTYPFSASMKPRPAEGEFDVIVKSTGALEAGKYGVYVDGAKFGEPFDSKGTGILKVATLPPGEHRLVVLCELVGGGSVRTEPVTFRVKAKVWIEAIDLAGAGDSKKQPTARLTVKFADGIKPVSVEVFLDDKSVLKHAVPPFDSITVPLPDTGKGMHAFRVEAAVEGGKVVSEDKTFELERAIKFSLLGPPRINEIRQRWESARSIHRGGPFAIAPLLVAPFAPGALQPGFMEDGLRMLNFARWLAGLPDDLTLDEKLNREAQYGALLLGAGGVFSHNPPQPPGMDAQMYETGVEATSTSNIGGGGSSLWESIVHYMDDSDPGNVETLGHRRWLLNPPMQRVGFGFVSAGRGKTNTATRVTDRGRVKPADYDWIAWPAPGAFPVELFHAREAWSVTLNPERFQPPDPAKVRVTLTLPAESASWSFDSSSEGPAGANGVPLFRVNSQAFGVSNCIIFRPGELRSLRDGDALKVHITGIERVNGSAAALDYDVHFFSLAESVAAHDTSVTASRKSAGAGHATHAVSGAGGRPL